MSLPSVYPFRFQEARDMRRQCEVVIRCSLCSRTSFGPLNRCSLSSSAGVSASDADDLEAHRYLLEQLGNRLGIKEVTAFSKIPSPTNPRRCPIGMGYQRSRSLRVKGSNCIGFILPLRPL